MNLTKEEIQEIIEDEIIVDAYSDDEVRVGWAIYMSENLIFPFEADYEVKKTNGENTIARVRVVNNKSNDGNFEGGDFYVEIEYQDMLIPVPLEALKNVDANEETLQAIHVWGHRGDYL